MRVVLALASLTLMGAWLLSDGDGATPTIDSGGEAQTPESAPTLQGDDASGREIRAGAAQRANSTAVIVGVAGGGASTGKAIHGRVRLRDETGVEIADPSGRLEVTWWSGGERTEKSIEVHAGVWRLALPTGATLQAGLFRWEDRVGVFDDPRPDLVSLDGQLTLTAELVPPSVLHVLDADSGAPLSGVRLVQSWTWNAVEYPPLSLEDPRLDREGILIRNGDSPLRLDPAQPDQVVQEDMVWVTAPGYAWKSIRLDTRTGGERTIRLKRGASVEVALSGARPAYGMTIRILEQDRAGEWAKLAERRLVDLSPVRFEGVPAGHFRVAIQRGYVWNDPEEFATAPCELQVGRLLGVSLQVPEVTAAKQVRWAGEIYIPPAWKLKNPEIVFEFQDGNRDGKTPHFSAGGYSARELTPLTGTRGNFHFDFGTRHPGRYHMSIKEIGFVGSVTLPEIGTRKARLHVSEPGKLVVDVVHGDSGRRVAPESVQWRMVPAAGGSSHDWQIVRQREENGRYEIRVPTGTIRVRVKDTTFYGDGDVHEVAEGRPHPVSIHVTPVGVIHLVFQEGDARVPYDWDWEVEASEIDGDGKAYMWRDGERYHAIWLTRRGRYRIRIHDIPGYKPLAVREVNLSTGEPQRLVFQLEPAK